jgi:hypothetical protein
MSNGFWDDGFCLIPGLFDARQCALLKQGIEQAAPFGTQEREGIAEAVGSFNQYKPVLGEILSQQALARIAACVGRPLLPTFSRWRIYERGMELTRHRDRKACEVAVSVTIHSEGVDADWPLELTDLHGVDHAPMLAPGDALVYQGGNVAHWRIPFAGDRHYQLFLFYVLADGDRADRAYDLPPGGADDSGK